MLYNFFSRIIHFLYGDLMTSKPIINSSFRLYYKIKDHLIFFGKKNIIYEKEIWDNILPYVQSSNLIFDIGGNIGQYAVRFSNNNDSQKKVITFEPDPINVAYLKFNINRNGIDNVEVEAYGVGYKNENLQFYQDTKTGGRIGSFVKGNQYSNPINIEIKSLESIIEKYGEPDFIKIDIEGLEDALFKNLTYQFQKANLLIEVREDSKYAVYTYFNKLGYDCYLVDNQKIKINSVKEIPGFANLLFCKG